MDLSKGFQIEEPDVFVPWDIPETTLQRRFQGLHLCHNLGFHFYPRNNGRLVELEFFHHSCPDIATSYEGFQHQLEQTFGPPTLTAPPQKAIPRILGPFLDARSFNFVQEHFGPAEYVRIQKTDGRGR
jgi:hypothetical protein